MSQATQPAASTPDAPTVAADTQVRLVQITDQRRHGEVTYQFLLADDRLRAARRSIADARGERVLDPPERSWEVPAAVRRQVESAVGVAWCDLAAEWGEQS